METTFDGKIDRSRRNKKMYKWKWMVLRAIGCVNNVDFEERKKKKKSK